MDGCEIHFAAFGQMTNRRLPFASPEAKQKHANGNKKQARHLLEHPEPSLKCPNHHLLADWGKKQKLERTDTGKAQARKWLEKAFKYQTSNTHRNRVDNVLHHCFGWLIANIDGGSCITDAGFRPSKGPTEGFRKTWRLSSDRRLRISLIHFLVAGGIGGRRDLSERRKPTLAKQHVAQPRASAHYAQTNPILLARKPNANFDTSQAHIWAGSSLAITP